MGADLLLVRAVEAATAVAQRYGVRTTSPVVLAHHSNALVHLPPAPIVARVATVIAELRRGGGWLRREVDVARYLAAANAAVVPPSEELPAGPHEHDGLYLTFWRFVPAVGGVEAALAGRSLRELHTALVGYDGPLPRFDPLAETDRLLSMVELAPEDAELLARARGEAAAAWEQITPRGQALHGDAHLANVIPTAEGPLWNDLEDTCTGPVEWDLACLVTAARIGGDALSERAAVAAYGDHDDQLVESLVPVRALFTTAYVPLLTEHATRRVAPAASSGGVRGTDCRLRVPEPTPARRLRRARCSGARGGRP